MKQALEVSCHNVTDEIVTVKAGKYTYIKSGGHWTCNQNGHGFLLQSELMTGLLDAIVKDRKDNNLC